MKTCPKCKEINGENQIKCFKCGETIGVISSYKKFCPKCGQIYSSQTTNCETCSTRLEVKDTRTSYAQSGGSDTWMYIVGILIPIVGIILGCIAIAKDDNELGKSLIITSIVVPMVISVLLMLLMGFF